MNYLGHKSSATVFFPLFTLAPLKISGVFDNQILSNVVYFFRDISETFIELINTEQFYIVFISIVFYWVGSTVIDFIDFKIIKPFLSKENRKYPYLYHRQWTHSFLLHVFLLAVIIYFIKITGSIWLYPLLFLSLGVWTHLITDMMTGTIPIFLFGHYAKTGSRIGINSIIPKSLHPFFSKKLPKIFDWASPVLFFIGLSLFMGFDGAELIFQPLYNKVF